MALDKLVDSSQLDGALGSTADAIRAKTGESDSLTWDMDTGFSVPIGDIVTLDEGTDDANATSGDILSGKTAYVKGAKVTGNIQTKTSSDMTVSGKTVTAPAGYYASNASKSVANGVYSAAVSLHSITTTPEVTGGISGSVTNISTTTQPSGTDGTTYWKITTTATTTTGVSTAKAKAIISTAGYIATGNDETVADTVSIPISYAAGTARYIGRGTINANYSGGTSSGTISRGKQIQITSGYYPGTVYYTAQSNSGTKNITSSGTISVDGYANVSVPSTSISQGTTTVSDATATRGNASWNAGWLSAGSIDAAVFANEGTSGTTYVDISGTTDAPVLVSGDYLYINKGYTDNLKISLAKLVPDGSDVKGHGEYILSGHSAYDDDGTLVAGTIQSKAAATYNTSTSDQTIAAGQYLSGAQTIRKVTTSNISAGNIKHNVTVKVGDAGDDDRIAGVTGTFTSSSTVSSGQTAAAAGQILNGYSAWVDGAEVKGSIAAKTSSDMTVDGKTVTAPAGFYATDQSKDVADGDYTPSVNSQGTNTAAAFTPSTTGTITDITTTILPSGTDGTDFWTITPGGSKTTGVARAKATATIGTAGYIAAGSKTTSSYTTWDITTNVNAGTDSYIPKAVIAGSSTNATATTTVEPGTVSVSKQDVPSGVTQAASGNATTTAPSSGVYVAVKATAAANSTGTTSSISGSGTATVTTAGYAPSTLTGTVSVSGTATAKTSAKDSSMTYVPITTATPAFKGGAVSGTATATASGASISTSTNNSGVSISAAASATRAVVQYNAAVNGWVSKAASADAYAASSATALTGTTYYINGVTLTAPSSGTRTFSVTVPNGATTATFFFNVDTSGNVTITES